VHHHTSLLFMVLKVALGSRQLGILKLEVKLSRRENAYFVVLINISQSSELGYNRKTPRIRWSKTYTSGLVLLFTTFNREVVSPLPCTLTYSLIHSVTQSLAHSVTQSPSQSVSQSFSHSVTQSVTHLLTHSFSRHLLCTNTCSRIQRHGLLLGNLPFNMGEGKKSTN
jgi:hypothetical protein